MGFRETYGSMVEAALNALVDKHLDGTAVKEKLHKIIDELVDSKLEEFKKYIKADVIDLINGVDDIK